MKKAAAKMKVKEGLAARAAALAAFFPHTLGAAYSSRDAAQRRLSRLNPFLAGYEAGRASVHAEQGWKNDGVNVFVEVFRMDSDPPRSPSPPEEQEVKKARTEEIAHIDVVRAWVAEENGDEISK